MLKKNDILLILLLLALGCLPLLSGAGEKKTRSAHITVNGKTERIIRLPSHQEETFSIQTPWGCNTVRVEGDTLSILEADCPDHICVKSGSIRQPGEVIACLPHKLLIEIRSAAQEKHTGDRSYLPGEAQVNSVRKSSRSGIVTVVH